MGGVAPAGANVADRFQLVSQLSRFGRPSDLVGHFVLGRSLPHEPDGWVSRSLGGWRLAVEAALPVRDLRDVDGRQVGWVLGHPLERGVGAAAETLLVSVGTGDELDRWARRFDGRFVVVAVAAGDVVPDSVASLPVVFDPERQLVSSSPFLLDAPDEEVPDHELALVVRTHETGLWFPFDTTPHARARRLQANHVLSLSTWAQRRAWPRGSFRPVEPEAANELIARRVTEVLTAAGAAASLNYSLTAGGDTRALLACSREFLDRTSFFTVGLPDESGRTDGRVASSVARRFRLDHRLLAWIRPTAADVARFRYRTGGLVGELRGSRAGPTYALLAAPESVYVSGINTGLAPVIHDVGWRKADRKGIGLSPRELLQRFALPRDPALLAAAERWLAGLPDLDPMETLSLLSIELRFGNWGGALTTAYPEAYSYTLYPFGTRDRLRAVLGLPAGYRFQANQRAEIVRLRWPELLQLPLNPQAPSARVRTRVRAIRTDAGVAARQLGIRR
jgi:hypothetical protein